MKRPQRPDPGTLVGQSSPQRPNEHLPDAFPDRERDRYASRALAYVILLNGAAALILVTALAFAPQSASDPRRLTWAMLVFGSGALAGLLSSLLAYIGRTGMGSSYLIVQDVLRVGAIIAAVGSGAAFLTGLNIMALMVPEASSTRPKSKPQDQTPAPTAPAHVVPQTTRATSTSVQLLDVLKQGDSAIPVVRRGDVRRCSRPKWLPGEKR